MKVNPFYLIGFSFCVLFSLAISSDGLGQSSYNIATYNIRFDSPNDHGNLWKDRSPHLFSQVKFHKMDIIGTQEGMHHQLEEMKKGLGYPYIGVGRDKGGNEGEFSAIFYDPVKFEVLEQATFWLSEDPNQPSKGWDAALNRVCTWGKFKDTDGEIFYVFNVHYDHIGQKAREESSNLVIKKIKEINGQNLPVILLGDFNVTPENSAYTTIIENSPLRDSKNISNLPSFGPNGTFTGFDWNKMPEGIIDHVFVSPEIHVRRHGILTDNYGLKYPSDHFPVMVEISLKN
ncbi:endonuclease/exonuclease/phosphatase family protein [Rhodonellum sp.]|uniref:endonuclease/exonuclease/phosphatase family protein n=1 Tax=Rhodonellum sp. TaxID=2231180 RepID=UPI0027274129|nr:endonuclease/exonuclease/phosphatase family protein [Rhodonellum sp.]MDO9551874.1 endonuclease/exonuclease/phosphatase family protein [Rhodonellum sp.]